MKFKLTQLSAVAAVVLTTLAAAQPALAQDKVKFALDWALQGNHAIWGLAFDNGHFAREKLDVTMDRGFGSGDTIIKVASGAYDIGFADANGLVKFNAENPDKRVIGVYQVFSRTLGAVITLKKYNIKTAKDIAGHSVGAPEGEGSRLLFPAFAKANGLDPNSVKWTSMAPNLRETMLAQSRVDVITGFITTSYFNLLSAGIPKSDIVVMPYAEHGLDLYGSTVMVREDYMAKNADLIKRFVKATIAGTYDTIKDPKAGMASLKKRDPLFDEKLELDRLQMALDMAMLTPEIKKDGFGEIDPARYAKSIKINAEALSVANPPPPDKLYTMAFMPPKSERMPK
jgi:NitT/TauT family transport system substrate-binding protein